MDKPTEVWNFISQSEALEVGPRKISFVHPLPHSFIHTASHTNPLHLPVKWKVFPFPQSQGEWPLQREERADPGVRA